MWQNIVILPVLLLTLVTLKFLQVYGPEGSAIQGMNIEMYLGESRWSYMFFKLLFLLNFKTILYSYRICSNVTEFMCTFIENA